MRFELLSTITIFPSEFVDLKTQMRGENLSNDIERTIYRLQKTKVCKKYEVLLKTQNNYTTLVRLSFVTNFALFRQFSRSLMLNAQQHTVGVSISNARNARNARICRNNYQYIFTHRAGFHQLAAYTQRTHRNFWAALIQCHALCKHRRNERLIGNICLFKSNRCTSLNLIK